jgi:hypothetical protein
MKYFTIFEWVILGVVIILNIGCCRNPYYCKKVTAIAIVKDSPIPCDKDNCGKIALSDYEKEVGK